MGLGKKATTGFVLSALGIVGTGIGATFYIAKEAAKKCASIIPPATSTSFNIQVPTDQIPLPGLPTFFNVSASLGSDTQAHLEKARELLSEFCKSSALFMGVSSTTILVIAAAVVAGTAYLYFRDTPASMTERDQGSSNAKLELVTYSPNFSPSRAH
ncbi:MAG: hypothetical protein ACD_45C00748G0001 [uncultured bacterium]|nr:MAG: hypothetical protein ACD_45C00748G0001 [uncultured bacterium]